VLSSLGIPFQANRECRVSTLTAVRSGEGQAYFDRFSEEEQRIFSTGVEAFTAAAARRWRAPMISRGIGACLTWLAGPAPS
jgi:hypothetical protein